MKYSHTLIAAVVVLAAGAAAAQTTGQNAFAAMKTLTGSWEGKTSSGDAVKVSYRLTAGGSALMSEIQSQIEGRTEDMISMIHLDGNRVLLTHYCAAGNQPRMQASTSPDGKIITFEFVDATNLATPETPHMDHVIFKFVDSNHHLEEWHFALPGKEMVEKFDLQRKS
jgi:hypothetical protein